MAKVKEFTAEFGMSVELKGQWYKYGCKLTVEVEPKDNVAEVKQKTWNTAITEVEKQIKETLDDLAHQG